MFNAIPVKIPMTFLTEIEKSTLKFIWKHKRSWIAKAILSKKSNAGGITVPDFKLYYRARAIKTAWYWHKNGYADQWNRIGDLDINPCNYSYLIFYKSAQNRRWRKDRLQQMSLGKLKLDPCLSPSTNIYAKWIKDFNIKPETLKLL
jgi:hypothetical protein